MHAGTHCALFVAQSALSACCLSFRMCALCGAECTQRMLFVILDARSLWRRVHSAHAVCHSGCALFVAQSALSACCLSFRMRPLCGAECTQRMLFVIPDVRSLWHWVHSAHAVCHSGCALFVAQGALSACCSSFRMCALCGAGCTQRMLFVIPDARSLWRWVHSAHAVCHSGCALFVAQSALSACCLSFRMRALCGAECTQRMLFVIPDARSLWRRVHSERALYDVGCICGTR